MTVLIVRENPQLRRVERAIAELEAQPHAEQLRKRTLLAALRAERDAILDCYKR
ncbi:MAG TPA: hypothetical protein VJ747_09065 [Stellaceae bacterium]|nr:hypothetical protein [Stellaceae bacterium]